MLPIHIIVYTVFLGVFFAYAKKICKNGVQILVYIYFFCDCHFLHFRKLFTANKPQHNICLMQFESDCKKTLITVYDICIYALEFLMSCLTL